MANINNNASNQMVNHVFDFRQLFIFKDHTRDFPLKIANNKTTIFPSKRTFIHRKHKLRKNVKGKKKSITFDISFIVRGHIFINGHLEPIWLFLWVEKLKPFFFLCFSNHLKIHRFLYHFTIFGLKRIRANACLKYKELSKNISAPDVIVGFTLENISFVILWNFALETIPNDANSLGRWISVR